jgi:hypothetical protein
MAVVFRPALTRPTQSVSVVSYLSHNTSGAAALQLQLLVLYIDVLRAALDSNTIPSLKSFGLSSRGAFLSRLHRTVRVRDGADDQLSVSVLVCACVGCGRADSRHPTCRMSTQVGCVRLTHR